jgi:hypothetical protein
MASFANNHKLTRFADRESYMTIHVSGDDST